MFFENFRLALSTIRQNKIRSTLTALGVIIAVWAVVLVVSIGNGIKSQINSEISGLGNNLITITPGKTVTKDKNGKISKINFASSMTTSSLTVKDLEDIQNIKNVVSASPHALLSGEVKIDGKVVSDALIDATNEDYPKSLNQKVQHGGFLQDGSNTSAVVIGDGINNEYFSGQNPIGSKLTIRGDSFIVTGVMEEFKVGGLSSFGPNVNNALLISLDNGKKYSNDQISIQEIDARIADGANVDQTVKQISDKLRKNQGGEENFTILKPEDLLNVTDKIFTLLTSGVGLIAGISIIVGGIGIMNIMLVSVTERTREIGLRKAIGAYPKQILQQFLVEAVVISLFGGFVGLLLAWLSGLIIKLNTQLEPKISIITILTTLAGSVMIGIASGMWPAVKAARKSPIDSLRYE
ncbi:ABC transporter permease [Candidatus Saccharibacteria bacterium]|jgi:putative ABC transport system permease protein|nr:ABC transporter permease [Candidatus Saccharibacteria bacterium]MBP9132347.1 ABC transporter permease [Candidatus Saccharibacteria bacterium]